MWILVVVIAFFIAVVLYGLQKQSGPRGGWHETYWDETAEEKGQWGELSVKWELGGTREGEQYLVNDLTVTVNGRSSQIDHLFINGNGLYVIETKNYSGQIYGSEKSREWTQVLAYGREKHKLYNPLKQNATHIYRLKEAVKINMPIYSLVVFAQGNTEHINAANVISADDLKSYVRVQGEPRVSPEKMKVLYDKLMEMKNNPTVSNQEHIAAIGKIRDDIENNICPRCGGQLVGRNGKYGFFFGCSNYPRCKFIKK